MNSRVWLASSLCASALLCVSFPSNGQTAFPKEGNIAATIIFQVIVKKVAMGEEYIQYIAEAKNGVVSDKPGDFADRLTGQCVGTLRLIKGKLDTELGSCEFLDLAGDKFYSSYTQLPDGNTLKERHTLIGGTGRYAGITGAMEGVREIHRPRAEGDLAGSVRWTGFYKLP